MIANIINSFSNGNSKPYFELTCHDITLNNDTIVPLGLVINEIITNSFRHAFNGANDSKFHVIIKAKPKGKFLMKIGDNGKGYNEKDINEEKTLGLQLIRILVEQLNGKLLKVEKFSGTHYEISFEKLVKVYKI